MKNMRGARNGCCCCCCCCCCCGGGGGGGGGSSCSGFLSVGRGPFTAAQHTIHFKAELRFKHLIFTPVVDVLWLVTTTE